MLAAFGFPLPSAAVIGILYLLDSTYPSIDAAQPFDWPHGQQRFVMEMRHG
jgi:hypothetical protein